MHLIESNFEAGESGWQENKIKSRAINNATPPPSNICNLTTQLHDDRYRKTRFRRVSCNVNETCHKGI